MGGRTRVRDRAGHNEGGQAMGLEMQDGGASGNNNMSPGVGDRSTLGLMTPGEVASLLHVDINTVARWSDEGKFRSVRTPGGHRRYFASDILDFAMKRAH